MGLISFLKGGNNRRQIEKLERIVDKIEELEPRFEAYSDEQLREMTAEFKRRLNENYETLDDILPEAFAVVREAAKRVLGMRHFRVQLMGGIVHHQGRIAEMRTGEGKTLVATLPAYLNALTGKGVHVVTVNDYLAKRDSEWMGKVHRFLGLTVGVIIAGMSHEQKKAAYACDITYGTNNEFGFDYLRDNMVVYEKDLVQRGLNYAIIDEVDSILIDEARTPLIISSAGGRSSDMYAIANKFVRTLKASTNIDDEGKTQDDEEANGDYEIDKKKKAVNLTERGNRKAEKFFNIDDITNVEHSELNHYINNALKAVYLMKKDENYIVDGGEVLIVDEFTGRVMVGRRYSDGLHQAIEAKENVRIQNENRTRATITFQNYFKLYTKLSGMTGTAKTEETEFRGIYGLDVVTIPTNRPSIRIDEEDAVYSTLKGKFNAIIKDVEDCYKRGQPVLVGTTTVDKSEDLSKMLRQHKIPHNVLNAKNHLKEAEIIAQAGKKGQVTIATNMAGRGTDIMLGGNAEYLAKSEMKRMQYSDELIAEATGFAETDNEEIIEARKTFQELEAKYKTEIQEEADKVRAVGGLFILGTERHDSRRIDNQLRGRSGRQGDPGESQFFLSLEDDLMRLFGGERMQAMMARLTDDENMPIESKMITRTVESSQKKVEGRNFGIRKQTLQYDDVMNRQRQLIYQQRDQVLDGIDLTDKILQMLDTNIEENVKNYFAGDHKSDWNVAGLKEKYKGWLTTEDDFNDDVNMLSVQGTIDMLQERGHKRLEEKRELLGDEMFQDFERMVLLRNVDVLWMDHIDAMDDLKQGIHLRAYAQQDPVVAFRMESYDMFDEMTATIRENTVRMMLTIMPRRQEDVERKAVAKVTATSSGGDDTVKQAPVRKGKKVGPNDPCPCGSGKKYKKCCGAPGKVHNN